MICSGTGVGYGPGESHTASTQTCTVGAFEQLSLKMNSYIILNFDSRNFRRQNTFRSNIDDVRLVFELLMFSLEGHLERENS